jgi:Fe-Mn family superoxide dismutase
MNNHIGRREVLSTIAVMGSAAILSEKSVARAETTAAPAAGASGIAPGKHAVVPLPFDPKRLKGLSEKLVVSHHDNNYGAAVKGLNKVEEELARVTRDTPAFLVSGLKERELTFTNSLILHEHYFANLGGDGKRCGTIDKALVAACGSEARWEEQFRATGMSLAGGSGWTILDMNLHTGQLRTYWSGNHTQSVAFAAPLLVMDMYEHAYQMDYGAAAAKYIDAFFVNIHWDEVGRRYERALQAGKAFRG